MAGHIELTPQSRGISGYHQRYLNLHRPFLIRSYREPRYIYSQRCCVESAFRITALHRETSSRPGLKGLSLHQSLKGMAANS